MITGQNSFKIDWRDWLRGMTTSDEVEDGGFSPLTTGVNLIAEPGVINAPGKVTDKSTNLADEIIASCDGGNIAAIDNIFLDDAGNFYSWNGTALTLEDASSTNSYTSGTSMLVPFRLNANSATTFYATTSTGTGDIAEWSSTALVEDWWTGATHLNQSALSSTTAWRPLLVWEDRLWVGDDNKLHAVDPDENATTPLTLPRGQVIVSLGIDKASGKMLVGTTSANNASATRGTEDRVNLYDGSSPKFDRVVRVDGLVTAFKNIGSSTVVFYGQNTGIWTGRGISFLRKLGVDLDSTELVYPHKVAAIENTLYIITKDKVLAYGPAIGGQKSVFYHALKNTVGSNDYTNIQDIGSGSFGVSFATSKFYTFDTTSIAEVKASGSFMVTRRYDFSRKVNLKGVRLQFKTLPTSGTDNVVNIQYLGDEGTTFTTLKIVATNELDTGTLEVDVPITDGFKPTSSMQFKYNIAPSTATNVSSLRKIIVYHDPAEE